MGNEKLSKDFFRVGSKIFDYLLWSTILQKINPTGEFELNDESKYSNDYEKEFIKNPLVKHVLFFKRIK